MHHLLPHVGRLAFGPMLLASASLCLPCAGSGHAADPAAAKPAPGDDAVIRAANSLYDDIRTATLPNGLKVYLKPIPSSPVVTTMVAYKVGSSDEDLTATGLSHYLEHLMFKGTNKIMPGDIDRLTLRNGGANNAYTTEDLTNYHFDFAADRWQDALAIEADRMRNLQIDERHEFQQEKGAVIEELQRDEDQPWDLEQKAIVPLLFGSTAPYGHPVIGERAHVRGATAAIIKAHYNKWYYPNNASLVICGGFDSDQALAKIQELFGPLPKGDLPARKIAPEIFRNGPVHKEIPSKFEVARMVMGFNTIRSGEPGDQTLDVINAILTGGKTGRLYKKLVEGEEIATSVDTSNNSGRYHGWFSVQVELLQGKDRHHAENLVLGELKRLRDEPVSDAELKRAKRSILSSTVFARESVHRLADSIARGVTTNDLDYLKNYLPRIAAVTAKDVQDTARRFFDPERRVVVWSVPQPRPGAGGAGAAGERRAPTAKNSLFRQSNLTRAPHRGAEATTSKGDDLIALKNARKVTLDNGLTLLLLENHRLPIVSAHVLVRQVRLLEPSGKSGLATLMGRLLDEGTDKHSGPEIAELIENVGGAMALSSSGGSVKVLSPDRSLGLSLLFECLTRPSFPQRAFAREQQRQLSEIVDRQQQPDARARQVYDEMVYGKHPYGRRSLGETATVQKLTPADCAAFHHKVFTPNDTLVAIVGDFDSLKVIDELKKLTAAWKKADVPAPQLPEVTMPEKFKHKVLTMPGAVQLHFYMGHPGIRRNNPDYYKLLVMDYVLGTGPGFTDRLSARLRDREGLAYTVTANISGSASEEPGEFTCYIGTDPRNFAKVKEMFLEELNRIRDTAPTAAEVEDAKKYLLGNLPFLFTTNGSIAERLLTVERYHLGFGYYGAYRPAVAAVTPEDVHAVARKYIHPDHMILVVAGPIGPDGELINKLPKPQIKPTNGD